MAVYMRKRINVQLTFFTVFVIAAVILVMSVLFYDFSEKQVFEDLRINTLMIKDIEESKLANFKELRIDRKSVV